MLSSDLFKNAAILDIETLDLARGSGIHQVAVLDPLTKHLTQIYVKPNLKAVQAETPQDVTKFATSPRDLVSTHPAIKSTSTWKDVIIVETLLNRHSLERVADNLGMTPDDLNALLEKGNLGAAGLENLEQAVDKELSNRNSFLYKSIMSGKFPYFDGQTPRSDSELLLEMKEKGYLDVSRIISETLSVEEMLDQNSSFMKALRGKVIWIANAEFESKQFGVQVAAAEQAARETIEQQGLRGERAFRKLKRANPLREIIRGTSTTTSDSLYVTGKEYLKVRAQAKRTGDWTPILKALIEHTEAGDVRDIIDVVKAQQSFLQKLGLISGDRPSQTSMDVQGRLYAYSVAETEEAGREALLSAESHVAREDVSLEERVRTQSLIQSAALAEVSADTEEGRRLLELAKKQQGPLYHALRYAQAYDIIAPKLEELSLGQRVGRLMEDFAREGETSQSAGSFLKTKKQYLPDGSVQKVDLPLSKRTTIDNIDEALEYLIGSQHYERADAEEAVSKIRADLISKGALADTSGGTVVADAGRLELEAVRLGQKSREDIGSLIEEVAKGTHEASGRLGANIVTPRTPGYDFVRGIGEISGSAIARRSGIFAASLAGLGLVFSGDKERSTGSIRTINYEKWLRAQAEYTGANTTQPERSPEQPNTWRIAGLPKGGIAQVFRSQTTDFGSPYAGPEYSNSVFSQLDLVSQREQYLRSAYRATHYDKASSIGNYFDNIFFPLDGSATLGSRIFGIDKSAFTRTTHSFLPSNAYSIVPEGKYPGIYGKGLLEINLREGGWKIEAPDADTIVVKNSSGRGSFRLAGIDAPETGKGGDRGQPYANRATDLARQMIAQSKDLRLIVNPSQVTYGRMVGTIIGDGQNINLELVKRGAASYLPYRQKGREEMYNMEAFEGASKQARRSQKGMWSTPYFQAYGAFAEDTGQTVTFNVLNNPKKVASNSGFMSLTAIMRAAQERGEYSSELVQETAELAKKIKATRTVGGASMRFGGAEYKSRAWRQIHTFDAPNAPHKTYMSQMIGELSQKLKTRGSVDANKTSAKKLGTLDKVLSIDSTQAGSLESKRQLRLNKVLGVNNRPLYYNTVSEKLAEQSKTKQVLRQIRSAERKQRMAEKQRQQNHVMFNSPINHQRM